jgi:phytoene synthase
MRLARPAELRHLAAMPAALSDLGAFVRRHDPDRFLTALFAPPGGRERLFLLYAVNHELARAREVASDPTLALIRLQWWREVAQGARRRHEVAGPLGEALDSGWVDAAALLEMIDGREWECDLITTRADWHAYLDATAGALAAAAGHALEADAATQARLRGIGLAYGVAAQLHSVTHLARQGRCSLPVEVLAAHGLSPDDVIANPVAPAMTPVLRELAVDGQFGLMGGLPSSVRAAGLPGVLARRDLARIGRQVHPRRLGDRLAVILAGVTGRM